MTEKTDPASSAAQIPSGSVSPLASAAKPQKKPRFALFIATAAGLGYLPKAPGTFGSLAGLALSLVPWWAIFGVMALAGSGAGFGIGIFFNASKWYLDPFLWMQILLAILVSAIGVWSSSRAAEYWQKKDPQRVVIDEVSGQHLALLIGCGVPLWWRDVSDPPWTGFSLGLL